MTNKFAANLATHAHCASSVLFSAYFCVHHKECMAGAGVIRLAVLMYILIFLINMALAMPEFCRRSSAIAKGVWKNNEYAEHDEALTVVADSVLWSVALLLLWATLFWGNLTPWIARMASYVW